MPVAASCPLDGTLRPSIDTIDLHKLQDKKMVMICKKREYHPKVFIVREMVFIIMKSSVSEGVK